MQTQMQVLATFSRFLTSKNFMQKPAAISLAKYALYMKETEKLVYM